MINASLVLGICVICSSLLIGSATYKTKTYDIVYVDKKTYVNEGHNVTNLVFYKSSLDTNLHGEVVTLKDADKIKLNVPYKRRHENGLSLALIVTGITIGSFQILAAKFPKD